MKAIMERRYDLDWVRVCAFGILVLYHVGMYYVSWDWHVKSPHASETIEPLMLLSSPWRLSLLFLVSGSATAFLLAKTPKGFMGSRSWRLLLPLIFGMLVIVPPQSFYEVLDSRIPGGYHDGYLAFWARYLAGDGSFCDDDGCLDLPTWNHLWFVAYLWVYTAVLWLLLKVSPGLVEKSRTGLARLMSGPGVLVWPAVLLEVVRLALVARFESTHALVDDWYNHAQFFPMFMLGFLAARTDGIWKALQRLRWPALVIAGASYGLIVWYFYGAGYDEANPAPDALRMLLRVVWAINQWTSIAAILGFAFHLAPGDSKALRYLTPAVFPVYILHQTVIVVAAYNLRPLDIPPLVEGPFLVLMTFAACFAAYEIIRRVGWMRPLFGLRARSTQSSRDPSTRQAPTSGAPADT
jgi:surface polysaccharide O-acyltransferase-like enzyme